ncbi:sugar transferase [Rhodococcus rhodochrous]|uniref:sugar transferase n=1 Tax=Rhodococcus rhodochrous TaxID=1829 RepID=UPI0020B10FB0|nr:sugar transferase [Rhodococcus rhodochrous]
MTAIGAASRIAPDALVGNNPNSVHGQCQPSQSAYRRNWQQLYVSRVIWSDAIVVVFAVVVAHSFRFGQSDLLTTDSVAEPSYTLISAGLVGLWWTALSLFRSRSRRVIGAGYDEYQRVISATLAMFGTIAIIALIANEQIARGFLAIALPVGLAGLLLSRWVWRKVVARKRARGEFQTSVLVVGGARAVRHMTRTFSRKDGEGYRVVGVCVPRYSGAAGDVIDVDGREITIYGDEHSVVEALKLSGADTVVVTATETLGSDGLHDLVWQLEPLDTDLVVATGVVDVAGPRIEMRPVAGLPLIHVEKPSYHGAKRSGKRIFDLVFAGAALVALAPVFAVVALLIKLEDRGPIFYKAERIGIDGTPFGMIKFRSMVTNADKMVDTLLAQNEGAGPLFKMKDDPRVTRIGKVMRRFSIDELPQFLNVIRGEMSVVGPRPPLRREVEAYDGRVKRRLLVRPGVTGLWQVSGRSDLSWDESVRLDLSYVENWSMVSDVLIIGKTVKAVLASDGAY